MVEFSDGSRHRESKREPRAVCRFPAVIHHGPAGKGKTAPAFAGRILSSACCLGGLNHQESHPFGFNALAIGDFRTDGLSEFGHWSVEQVAEVFEIVDGRSS